MFGLWKILKSINQANPNSDRKKPNSHPKTLNPSEFDSFSFIHPLILIQEKNKTHALQLNAKGINKSIS